MTHVQLKAHTENDSSEKNQIELFSVLRQVFYLQNISKLIKSSRFNFKTHIANYQSVSSAAKEVHDLYPPSLLLFGGVEVLMDFSITSKSISSSSLSFWWDFQMLNQDFLKYCSITSWPLIHNNEYKVVRKEHNSKMSQKPAGWLCLVFSLLKCCCMFSSLLEC